MSSNPNPVPMLRLFQPAARLFIVGAERGLVTFARGQRAPSIGERFELIDTNMRIWTLVVIADVRPLRSEPRRLVRIVPACSICNGSGAVQVPGRCPECSGKGCPDCEGIGTIDWSDCHGCNGGRI